MSVRVVRDVPCPNCNGEGVLHYSNEVTLAQYETRCRQCLGRGLIAEPLTCATCALWAQKGPGEGICMSPWMDMTTMTPPTFGCAAWTATEGQR